MIGDYDNSEIHDDTYCSHVIHLRIINKIQEGNNIIRNNQFKYSTHFKNGFFKFLDVR